MGSVRRNFANIKLHENQFGNSKIVHLPEHTNFKRRFSVTRKHLKLTKFVHVVRRELDIQGRKYDMMWKSVVAIPQLSTIWLTLASTVQDKPAQLAYKSGCVNKKFHMLDHFHARYSCADLHTCLEFYFVWNRVSSVEIHRCGNSNIFWVMDQRFVDREAQCGSFGWIHLIALQNFYQFL